MNLEYIKKKESRLIELIYKYFSVLDEYRNGKGKKDDFQYLYEEISDFYVEEKNKFIKKKYGGMVRGGEGEEQSNTCILCLGEAEDNNPLYSHEHIAMRGEDGNPTNRNTACFFHVDCLKDMIQHKLRVDESEVDNYYIECPMCKSVLISSKIEIYDTNEKRFVAIKKPNHYNNRDIPGFNLVGFRNIPADWNREERVFDAIPNRFLYALLMLLWLLFFIAVYYHNVVNQDNAINRIEQDITTLHELNNNLYRLSNYARRDENEAIRVLNNLVATFYDNINYEIANRIELDDNMENNDEFIEAFSNALNRAFPHNELGGKKKRKKKSMKKKTKKKRSKKNKTKKKKN